MVAAVVAALVTTGCTNTRQDVSVVSIAKSIVETRKARRGGTQQIDDRIVQAEINRALAAQSGPLALIKFEKTGRLAILRQIETNGPYRTWSTWGSSERRSITTRGGVVTATRGLGNDLMSSSINDLLQKVMRLHDGTGQQILRHLSGEHTISETLADCAFTPEGRENFKSGNLNLTATRVDVFCKTETASFNNVYLVSGSGRIVSAKQWLGEGLGYATLRALR